MAATNISWASKVWNPIVGCSRVSPGCGDGPTKGGGCYAEAFAHRLEKMGQARYKGLTVVGKQGPRWTGVVREVPEVLSAPLRWRKPQRIFVNSMSDLFHEKVRFEYIAAVFGVMAACPQHTFLILTKRPERALAFFEWLKGATKGHWHGEHGALWESLEVIAPGVATAEAWKVMYQAAHGTEPATALGDVGAAFRWPLPNVHFGVSVEDQAAADKRIPLLLKCPAAIHWVSYEPALGPVDFRRWLHDGSDERERGDSLSGRARALDRDSRGRIDLAHSPATQEPNRGRDGEEGSASSDRRPAERRGLPDGEDHGGRGADVMPGASAGVADAEGTDPARHHDQSRGRGQGEQLPLESVSGDLFGTTEARASNGAGVGGRRREPSGEAGESGDRGDQDSLRDGKRDSEADRGLPGSGPSNGVEDRSGRAPAVAGRTDCGLRESSGAGHAGQERAGSVRLRQIIVGGESGSGYRRFDPVWADDVVAQCRAAGIACFVKQDSGPKPGKQGRLSAETWARKEFPALAEIARAT